MSSQSSNLQLPFLEPAQAQKHVTVNEALLRLDALVQLCVASATTAAQPVSPADGALYILPAGKSGAAWGAMADAALAYWRDGAWEAITPKEGWLAYVKDADQLRLFNGSAWTQSAARTALSAVGVGDSLTVSNIFGASPASAYAIGAETVSSFFNGGYLQVFGSASGPGAQLVPAAGTSSVILTPTAFTVNANAVFHGGAHCLPTADIGINLGSGAFRFGTVYAATGAINTSDAREKTPLAAPPDSLKRAMRRIMAQVGVFQWCEAVARKGKDHARLHVGVTAQAVRDAFAAEGEDPARWALFCEDAVAERSDAPGEPVTRLGVRTDQLMWLALLTLAEAN